MYLYICIVLESFYMFRDILFIGNILVSCQYNIQYIYSTFIQPYRFLKLEAKANTYHTVLDEFC